MHSHYIDRAIKDNLISLGIISIISVFPFSLLIMVSYFSKWSHLIVLSLCGTSLLGYLSSLLLADYYSRFHEPLRLYDKKFFIFLWHYFARAIFVIFLLLLTAKCEITILQFIRNILIDYSSYNYQESTNIVRYSALSIELLQK